MQAPNIANGVGALVGRALERVLRAGRAQIVGDSCIGLEGVAIVAELKMVNGGQQIGKEVWEERVPQDIEPARGMNLGRHGSSVERVNNAEKWFESAVGNASLDVQGFVVEDGRTSSLGASALERKRL